MDSACVAESVGLVYVSDFAYSKGSEINVL